MRFPSLMLLIVAASSNVSAEERAGTYPQTIDRNDHVHRQVLVDREAGQYLGHPTTCLLEDGKTILCVYPKGHGRGAIMYKRSTDAGLTWSDRLATPASWATSQEVPTLHRVIGPDGKNGSSCGPAYIRLDWPSAKMTEQPGAS